MRLRAAIPTTIRFTDGLLTVTFPESTGSPVAPFAASRPGPGGPPCLCDTFAYAEPFGRV